ncbi:cation:proton antiporter [Tepiditoga spiralis]|uniref:Cation:proton antiporter n=1 Tax=Tepiditoga spiralis TaxID=2108365 RepID=A0A7G1G676_9BACT|nr:MnhB domain-containing protein [Tepiditoga spiralis]BBE32068.1 cation:proton antiporter [Tepiditoga spiralis]
MKKIIVFLLLLISFLLLLINLKTGNAISVYTAEEIKLENTSKNMVSAIVLDYRMLDTFFEVLVFTLAITGVSYYLKKLPEVKDFEFEKESGIVEIITPILFQLLALLAFYAVVTGHVGTGGGFSAGVILGTALLGVTFVKPIEDIERVFKKSKIEKYKYLTPLIIVIYGMLGKIWGGEFFCNFPILGNYGHLFSGGSAIFLNFLIGIEVFAGTWTILYKFIKHRGML